ncbi:MAG: YceD family protein [Gammaproteobacteria bacterium]|jgi:uncharacterized protein
MIDHLPDRLDLIATAEAGRVLRGRVPLTQLERLAPLLLSQEGELEVDLELGKARDGTRYLSGRITGTLALSCQRCLEEMRLPLDIRVCLGLVRSQAAAQELNRRYEPLIVSGEPARLAEVVTDEVLLALPIVAVHGDMGDCRNLGAEYAASAPEGRENPFAVLERLKQKH